MPYGCRGEGVPYHGSDIAWDKNKVARIINNDVYLGTASYPALVDKGLYDRAVARKPKSGMTEKTAEMKAIREMSRCASCGGKIRMSARREGWTRWNCEDCGALGAAVTTEKVMNRVEMILQALACGKVSIIEPPTEVRDNNASPEDRSAFDAMLDEEHFNETLAMYKALELAATRFDHLDTADYETMRIRYLLEQAERPVDLNLLREIASVMLIQPNGEVDIKMKNGQTIGGNDAS